MARKKMKRKTLVALLVVSTVVAVGGVLGIIEGSSGAISKTFEVDNMAEYKYYYDHELTGELTDDKTLTQKIDLSSDTTSPFKKAVYNLNLYGDEEAGIVLEDPETAFAKNCSKLEIKLTLKDDVDFFVSNLSAEFGYYDNSFNMVDDHKEGLDFNCRIGVREFVTYTNQSYVYAFSQNAYSNDIVITIKNDKAREKEDSLFRIPDISFNFSEVVTWTAEV